MPIHDLGYRSWSGRLDGGWQRAIVIARAGVRRAWLSGWLRRFLLLAWLPTIWFSLAVFLYEQSAVYPEMREALVPFLLKVPEVEDSAELIRGFLMENSNSARRNVWAWLLQLLFRYPQGVIMLLVVGLIAPSLISQDNRSRAFLLYFSRPLSRGEYLLGKAATIWVYIALITTVPALSLYSVGILLSPSIAVVQATWDLPIRILIASAVLMIPTSALALCISSLTQESRYAAFAWFAIWILGWFTYSVMAGVETATHHGQLASPTAWWTNLSLYHILGRVQTCVFGFTPISEIRIPAAILVGITVIATAVLFRRVSAPLRA